MEVEKEEDEVEAELRNGINTPTLIILLYILCESSPEKNASRVLSFSVMCMTAMN